MSEVEINHAKFGHYGKKNKEVMKDFSNFGGVGRGGEVNRVKGKFMRGGIIWVKYV